MYLGILAMLRLVLRRQVGGIGTADVLVVVLIAEAAGNSIAPQEQSVVEGVLLVVTILFWSYLIEWRQFRFPGFQRLVRDPKLKLIENGRMLRRNMRREFVTFEELMAHVRKKRAWKTAARSRLLIWKPMAPSASSSAQVTSFREHDPVMAWPTALRQADALPAS